MPWALTKRRRRRRRITVNIFAIECVNAFLPAEEKFVDQRDNGDTNTHEEGTSP
jgi:hypothetical protein